MRWVSLPSLWGLLPVLSPGNKPTFITTRKSSPPAAQQGTTPVKQSVERLPLDVIRCKCWGLISALPSTLECISASRAPAMRNLFPVNPSVFVCVCVCARFSVRRWGVWYPFSASQDIWFRAPHLEPANPIWRGVEPNLSAYVGNTQPVSLLSYRPSVPCLSASNSMAQIFSPPLQPTPVSSLRAHSMWT